VARVLSVGNAVVDLVMAVPHLPERGGDVTAEAASVEVGGSGYLALLAAVRLGAEAVYAGAHGTGPFGELVRAACAREGIGLAHPPDADADTGWDVALVEPDAERSFATAVGAEARLDAAMLARVVPAPGDLVHVTGYGLARRPSGAALASWVAALPAGVVVLFDPGPLGAGLPAELLEPVLARADWWSGNETEALAASAARTAEEAAGALARRVPGILVRRGARGCLLRTPDGVLRELPGLAVRAVDTTGAGDTHVGAFLAGLAAGLAPEPAAARANAAAALAVTRPGPAGAPTEDELSRTGPLSR